MFVVNRFYSVGVDDWPAELAIRNGNVKKFRRTMSELNINYAFCNRFKNKFQM